MTVKRATPDAATLDQAIGLMREAEKMRDAATALEAEARILAGQAWGCQVGDIVMTKKGEMRVSRVNFYGCAVSRPAINGYRRKKNGDWHIDSQYIGRNWESIE